LKLSSYFIRKTFLNKNSLNALNISYSSKLTININPHNSIQLAHSNLSPKWLKEQHTCQCYFQKTSLLNRLMRLCTCHAYIDVPTLKTNVAKTSHDKINPTSSLSMVIFHTIPSAMCRFIRLMPPKCLTLCELDTSWVMIKDWPQPRMKAHA